MAAGWNPGGEAELERDGKALRRLARALVRDASTADDLVQDAWVVALERRERAAQGGAFLSGVVRRLALGWRRAEARRGERENASAGETQSPRPDEIAERLELSELVLRTLRGLPEPYRSTLILHFFDGLPAGAIARKTGVPAGTVRARLTRGIEELRARVRPRLEREGRDWRQALLPIAGTVHGPMAAWGALTIMGVKWAFGCVAVAALVVLGWQAWQAGAGREASPGALVGPSGIAGPEEAAPVESRGAGAEAGRRDAASPVTEGATTGTTRVVARAVDDDGHPLSGARLALAGSEPGPVSDASGALLLVIAEADAERLVQQPESNLVASADGHSDTTSVVRLHAGQTNWLGDLVLLSAGELRGRVCDSAGRGLSGALVIATQESLSEDQDTWMGPGRFVLEGPRRMRCAGDGSFAFAQLPEGWWIVLATDTARPWMASERIPVRGGAQAGPITLVLGAAEPARTLAGRVLEPDGKPCAGARAMLVAESGIADYDEQRITSADGRFEFHTREPGTLLRVHALEDGGARFAELVREVRTGEGELVLQFKTATQLRVLVRDQSGEPLGSTPVFAYLLDDRPLHFACRATTDSEGRATMREPQASYSVLVDGQGFERAQQGPFEPGSAPLELEFRLQRGAGLRGRVTANGQGFAGAHLRLLELAQPGVHFEPLADDERAGGWTEEVDPVPEWQANSAAEGRFTLGAPRATKLRAGGRFMLVAEARGWAAAVLGPLDLGNLDAREGLELALTPGGSIDGRLVASPPRSLAGWRIVASSGFGCLCEALVDPQGRFRFEHLAPGRWQLAPQPPPAVRDWTWHESEEAQPARVQILVEEGRTRVVDCELPPLEETFVEGRFCVRADPPGIWSAQLVPLSESSQVERQSIRGMLRLDSTFRLRTHGYGRYRLLLECDDPRWGAAQVSDIVELGADGAHWSGEIGFARLSGQVSPNTQHLFCFAPGPGELRASSYFRPREAGLIGERWIPRGRVLITDEPHPPGEKIEHPLATIEVREGEMTTIELH